MSGSLALLSGGSLAQPCPAQPCLPAAAAAASHFWRAVDLVGVEAHHAARAHVHVHAAAARERVLSLVLLARHVHLRLLRIIAGCG